VEQSLDFATTIADYTYIMDKHTIVAQGGPDELTDEMVRQHLTV
jgi:urea transport system ATP-binding protein